MSWCSNASGQAIRHCWQLAAHLGLLEQKVVRHPTGGGSGTGWVCKQREALPQLGELTELQEAAAAVSSSCTEGRQPAGWPMKQSRRQA